MSDGKIEQRVRLSRQEAARWLGELSRALAEGGTTEVALVGPRTTLTLPDEFEVELELEPYGDKIELEIEFEWPNPGPGAGGEPRTSVPAADSNR